MKHKKKFNHRKKDLRDGPQNPESPTTEGQTARFPKPENRNFTKKTKNTSSKPPASGGFTDRSGKFHAFGRPSTQSSDAPQGGRDRPRQPESDSRPQREFRVPEGPKRNPPPRSGSHQLLASIQKNKRGFGFLVFERGSINRGGPRKIDDSFIPAHIASKYLHGDRVQVTLDRGGEVNSIKVLEHRFHSLVGRFSYRSDRKNNSAGVLIYEAKNFYEEVQCPKALPGLKDGDWVFGKLHFDESKPPYVTAELLEHFGPELPPKYDILQVASEFGLIEKHTEAALKEAHEFEKTFDWTTLKRTDLRHIPFVTIDGETARDFDDAIYVEKKNANEFILWVAIADVSYFVSPGTAIDQEAYARATSVYFPERAFHMLPGPLSENLCSLKPNVPRLGMVAKMTLDSTGAVLKTEVMDGIIESKRRWTYNEIQIDHDDNLKNPRWPYHTAYELYEILKKMRVSRGSIDFDFPEPEIIVDKEGNPTDSICATRLDSHRLIEEFMICANESVTEWALERKLPFIYRVHDGPKSESILRFQRLAASFGVRVKIPAGDLRPKQVAEIREQFLSHPAEAILSLSLLQSMKQAIYTSEHSGHFGLASKAYTHFTSPIRRYPDLLVHRALKLALETEKKTPGAKAGLDPQHLAEAAQHCSYRERLADDAETECQRIKQVRLASLHLGNQFVGKISGMNKKGLFVQIKQPFLEGFIDRDQLGDPSMEYNEEKLMYYGRRSKKKFQFGQELPVVIARTEVVTRRIEFALVDEEGLPIGAKRKVSRQERENRDRLKEIKRTRKK